MPRWLSAVLLCAAPLLTGCTSTNVTASPPAPPAWKVWPVYTEAQLVSALPRTRQELHGLAQRQSCWTIRKPCQKGNPVFGEAWVSAGPDEPGRGIAVTVSNVGLHPGWMAEESCPRGWSIVRSTRHRFDRPFEQHDFGGYSPGQRGTAHRVPLHVRDWLGFACEKSVVYLWPANRHSPRYVERESWLSQGKWALVTRGRTLRETELLAREYVARLAVVNTRESLSTP